MKIHPLNDKILVKVATKEEVTSSGIILPANSGERLYEGTVVEVGTNPDIAVFGIKPGDYVVYQKGLNIPFKIGDVEHDMVSIYDLTGIGEEEQLMPAFGKNGMVNLNQKESQTVWQLVKPDGTVVKSGLQKDMESEKETLSKQLNCELVLKTSAMQCIQEKTGNAESLHHYPV